MHIVRCDESFNERWDAFVQTSTRASFYHRCGWRAVNEHCFGHRSCYLAAMEGDRIVGVFPLVQLKSLLFGNIACSLPFVNYGGPCGENEQVEAALLDAGAKVADEWGVEYLEIRSQRDLGERFPSSTHKVSMTLALDSDSDKLWSAFKTGQRQEIRRGYKNGFTVTFGGAELIGDFYAVLSETWRDLGTPIFSRAYLDEIYAAFPGGIRIGIIYDARGEPAGGAFDGLQGGTVEGMWLGVRSAYKRQLAGYVLYWELIKHACENGFTRFHFGRSSVDSGAEQFKKKWNATASQLYWHYLLRTRAELPQLNVANRKFQLAMAAWKQLPVNVARRIGPMIARSIP